MRLVIRSFSSSDIGTYNCVSTNSLGKTEGTLRLYGKHYFILSLVYINIRLNGVICLVLTYIHTCLTSNKHGIYINNMIENQINWHERIC
ncbi:hypothetical protein O3M35_007094 [Rhynocoris fuscipes]|uniref:Immunoglobulin I-set domain-containing protein n=1 Tax=Rhynocoris fuscipes TaxID=488301 RepID=A0AAW1D852_9HEMI